MSETNDYVPFWRLFQRVSRTGHSTEQLLSVYRDYGVVPREGREDNNNRPGTDISKYQLVEPGDLAVNKMKAWQGSLGVSDFRGIVSPAYFVYKPLHSSDPRYLNYVLRSRPFINLYAANSKGIRPAQWDLQPERLDQIRIPAPPLPTQRAIADYLDRETAEIDGMRADLDEMERLLEERRAAVIDTTITATETTHTVRVGYIAELITGLTYSPQDIVEDGGTVVLRSGNIQSSKINLEDEVQVRLSIPDKLRVRSGDILVCARNGSAKLVGKSAKLTSEEQGFTWGAFMTVVRSDINEWLFWYLHSNEFEHMRGDFSSSTINQLTNGTFSRIPIPVEKDPCRRNELTEELARETAEIDSMLEDITKLRDLLAERRAAVISAAVTGQIDIPVSSTHKD